MFKLRIKDYLIIASIIIVALSSILFINLSKKEGSGVIVKIDGVIVAEYSFENEGEYSLNGGTNILVIKDKKAWIKDANCKDHYCMNQGKISKEGETITCLPNKLTITVYGEKDIVEI